MGLFEQYPWLLVILIIVTSEIWSLAKALFRELVLRRRARPSVEA